MPLCWLVVVICSYLYRHLEVVIFGHIFFVFTKIVILSYIQ